MIPQFTRTVWSALDTRQSRFAVGGGRARRFDPEVHCFAAARDDSAESLAALEALAGDGDGFMLVQKDAIVLPDGLEATVTATGVLLVKRQAGPAPKAGHAIRPLTKADWPDMHSLAALTKPGPFKSRTPELGEYWGIFEGGRLAAMAGERLSFDGYTEVSGVCTHPDFRGRGFATALTIHVTTAIEGRGDTPFLHAYADNCGAIRLYESLGYAFATEVNVAAVGRRAC